MIWLMHTDLARNSAQTGGQAMKGFSQASDHRSIDLAALPDHFAGRGVCQYTTPSPDGRPRIPKMRPPAFSRAVLGARRGQARPIVAQAKVFDLLNARMGGCAGVLLPALGEFPPARLTYLCNGVEPQGLSCVCLSSSDQHKGSMSCSAKNGSRSASFVPHSPLAAKPWANKPWSVAQSVLAVQQPRVAAWGPAHWSVLQRTWHIASRTRAPATNRLARLRAAVPGGRDSYDNTPRSGLAAARVFLCPTPAASGNRAPMASGKRGTNVQ